MGRIGRSFQLVRMSYRVLLQDKELMLLPLVSGTVMAAVVFAIAAVSGIDIWRIDRYGSDAAGDRRPYANQTAKGRVEPRRPQDTASALTSLFTRQLEHLKQRARDHIELLPRQA
jgi:hypothetical protein